jgi:NADPH-dependent 2,4-dienoyl-CoA reductase/sulfur reductase-like enzyme
VTLVFPEDGIGARVFPRDLALHLNGYYAERGVDVRAGEQVSAVAQDRGGFTLRTTRAELRADLVVAGLGIVPNDRLAADAGLAVEDGIVVDDRLRTPDPDVLAAGDVARFPSAALGTTRRAEHEDNALRMGFEAGRQLAGAEGAYRHEPFFYSDLFDLGYEAVGLLDPRQEVVARWEEPFRRGVVYYLSAGRVRGVLAWGIFGKVDAARALLADQASTTTRSSFSTLSPSL